MTAVGTSTGSSGQTMTTIDMIAHRAVSDPKSLSEADIVRLGSSWVDRREHILAHQESMRIGRTDVGVGFRVLSGKALSDRLEAQRPQPGDAPKLAGEAEAEPELADAEQSAG